MTQRAWYRFQNVADDPTTAELIIFGSIGTSWWDDEAVSAKQFMDDLKGLRDVVKKIVVRVNSLGGDVFDAVAIANALRDQIRSKGRTVTTIVDGIAASAASIVIMAGETIQIADNAMVMVHSPWTFALGNAAEMRKSAEVLDQVRGVIVATYRWHSELSEKELVTLMDDETWMDADAAIANGFATEKVEGLKAAASIDPRAAAKLTVPEQCRARVDALLAKPDPPPQAPTPAAAADVLRLCRLNECLDLAEGLVEANATLEQVQARVATEREARAQARARETEIRALCAAAKQPDMADDYVKGGMAVAQVRAQLTLVTAKLDRVEIDAGLGPDAGSGHKPAIDTQAVYAQRNKLLRN